MHGADHQPADLLRTFIAVVELGGHSKAGALLGRSQPAISLQLGRLEDLIRAPLLTQDGRKIQPAPAGEALLSFAREMVRINDEAVAHFHRADMSGVLRIGLYTGDAVSVLQGTLTGFIQRHPEVELENHRDLSRALQRPAPSI
ncbi:LysR family transcriptional regulator [Rhodobacter sp. Har01]|nr:LysR family transcriptional regulator [Rhodobacter sp. Har01]